MDYKEFHYKLIPTVEKDKIIGIRTPALRKFAKELFKTGNYNEFLKSLPHKYYEENNLHAFLIEQVKDYALAVKMTKEFLPYIDNWATCDMFMPKVFKNNKSKILEETKIMLKSNHTYTVRYGIGILMKLFLDEDFSPKNLQYVCDINSNEYYINMMRAWFFATALAKQYEKTIPFIKDKKLDTWTHNKAIQKSIESNRISPEIKEELKMLKIKSAR